MAFSDLQDPEFKKAVGAKPDASNQAVVSAWLVKNGLDPLEGKNVGGGVRFKSITESNQGQNVEFYIPKEAQDAFAKAYGQKWSDFEDGDNGTPIANATPAESATDVGADVAKTLSKLEASGIAHVSDYRGTPTTIVKDAGDTFSVVRGSNSEGHPGFGVSKVDEQTALAVFHSTDQIAQAMTDAGVSNSTYTGLENVKYMPNSGQLNFTVPANVLKNTPEKELNVPTKTSLQEAIGGSNVDTSNFGFASTVDEQKDETNIAGWKKVGGQKGSNPGGTYEDTITGEQFYVKTPKSELHGENERLASALYQATGVSAAKVLPAVDGDGNKITYSPIIEGSKHDLDSKLGDKAYMEKLQQGFAVDAWLANWDVAGLTYDNVVTNKNGDPVRVDPGGALLFRAQGEPKGKEFGNNVAELFSFTDKTSTRPSAKVFSSMTEEQKTNSAKLLQKIGPSQIDELVDTIVTDPSKRDELKSKLKARRNFILNQFGLGDSNDGGGGGNGGNGGPSTPEAPSAPTPVAAPTPSAPSTETLSDGKPATVGTKVVHTKTGETGVISKEYKNPGYIIVKGADGKNKIKSTNLLKTADDSAPVQTAQSAAPSNPGTSATPGTSGTTDAKYDESDWKQIGSGWSISSKENGTHLGNVIATSNGGQYEGSVLDPSDPTGPYLVNHFNDEEDAKAWVIDNLNAYELGIGQPEKAQPAANPGKFKFDIMNTPGVIDSEPVASTGDIAVDKADQIISDVNGKAIKPGEIVTMPDGTTAVYKKVYLYSGSVEVITSTGSIKTVSENEVYFTATGKSVPVYKAYAYSQLAPLDFEARAIGIDYSTMAAWTTGKQDSQGKNIYRSQLVTDKNGDLGVALSADANGYVQVAFPDGTKNRKSNTLTTLDKKYSGNLSTAKQMQKNYKSLMSSSDYNLPTFGKTVTSKPGSVSSKPLAVMGEIQVPSKPFGEKAEVTNVLPWSQSGFSDLPDLETLIASVKTDGNGLKGGSIALDSDSVEDLDLRIMSAVDANGSDAYLMKFKLTSWAGDSFANDLLKRMKDGDTSIEVLHGLTVPKSHVEGDKVSFADSPTGNKEAGFKDYTGETFKITLDDGTQIHFMRADSPTSHKTGPAYFSENAPRAYHNKVMIIASSGAVADSNAVASILASAGVKDVRPSVQEDAQILIENRLMSVLAGKVDPKTNPSGSTRKQVLKSIEDEWGITPANVTISSGAGGRVEMRLDAASAEKITKKTGITFLTHRLSSGYAMGNQDANETEEEHINRALDWFASRVATPQGGLLSTTTRWSEGVSTSGMSSTSDIRTGGADYVFTTPQGQTTVSSNSSVVPAIYFDPNRAFQRLDFWANLNDKFGKRVGKSPIDQAKPHGYEVMFKGRLSFDDAAALVVRDQDIRTRLITKLRQKGIKEIGGRPLEAVIVTKQDYVQGTGSAAPISI